VIATKNAKVEQLAVKNDALVRQKVKAKEAIAVDYVRNN
jgi:hypothetical protein